MMSTYDYSSASMRRVNFTHSEKRLLLALVEKSKCWAAEGTQEGMEWRKKSEVWGEITENFNMRVEERCRRDAKQLRKCWENMKNRYRKNNPGSKATPENLFKENAMKICHDGDVSVSMLDEQISHSTMSSFVTPEGSAHPPPLVDITLEDDVGDVRMNSTVVSNGRLLEIAENKLGVSVPSIELPSKNSSVQNEKPLIASMAEPDHRAHSPPIDPALSIVNVTSNKTSENSDIPIFSVRHDNTSTVNSSTDALRRGEIHGKSFVPLRKRKRFINTQPSTIKMTNFGIRKEVFKPREYLKQHPRVHQNLSQSAGNHGASQFQNNPHSEKFLRLRFVRNRIREQETRLRMMQQKMRHERERHEAIMSLLHKRAAYYETQTDELRSMEINGDNEFCDDFLWDTLS